MKTIIQLLYALFITCSSFAQTIRIADNNPNAPAGTNVFTTVQEAVDAASPGDIVQVTPSESNYGSVVITKSITMQGIGYNPDKTSPFLSLLDQVTIQESTASGTVLSGLRLNNINLAADIGVAYTLDNITIENCNVTKILQTTSNTVSNLLIRNNFLRPDGSSTTGTRLNLATDDKIVNAEISNNIITGYWGGSFGYGSINAGNFTLISNNLFAGNNNVNYSFAFNRLFNCIVTNNIFYGRSPRHGQSGQSENNVFSNNLSFGSNNTLPPPSTGTGANTGSGNLQDTDPMFTNVPLGGNWSFNYDPTLLPGSPAIGTGTGGIDMGVLDGNFPFTNFLTGSPIPVIQNINTSGLVNEGENLSVEIQATSN